MTIEVLTKEKKANIEIRVWDKIRSTVRTISLYAPDDNAETIRDRIKSVFGQAYQDAKPIKKEVEKRGVK